MTTGESAVEGARLPERPLLKPWYRISTSDSGAVLRYGGSVLEFEGRAAVELLPHLLPLLDGSRTLDELAAQLGEPIRPAVEHALGVLAEHDLLTEPVPADVRGNARRTVEFLAATDPYGRNPATVLAALRRASAVVVGSSPAARAVHEWLTESVGRVAAVGWRGEVGGAELAVAAPAPDEVAALGDWNRRALAEGFSWLQVLPFDGLIGTVGPIFVPHQSACHECYRLRRAANIAPVPDLGAGRYPTAPAFDAVLAGLATLVALRRLATGDGRSVGVLLAVEQAPELGCTRHVLHRVPRCPACSPAAERAAPLPWHGVDTRVA